MMPPNVDDQISKVSPDLIRVPKKPGVWSKPTDQMDTWLDSQGFYRKHIARDASSLFRCVSEVVFLTQVHHLSVRKHCMEFALNQPDIFKALTNTPVKDYVDRLSNAREIGTTLDMEVMSKLYRLDFAVYKDIKKPLERVTNNGYRLSILLSVSYEHHYDSVYPKHHIDNAAMCQSVLYEILYKEVFKLEEVDYAVDKMLHDKTARYQTELNVAMSSAGYQIRLEMRDNCRNVKELLNYGITPFPYKVAKSLDVNIYRNVEHDTWNDQRKGIRHMLCTWNDKELQEGSRCIVNLNENKQIFKRHGYIQQMSPNKGPVVIYVPELGKKLTVPIESLELIPVFGNETEDDEEELHEETSCLSFKGKPFDIDRKPADLDNNPIYYSSGKLESKNDHSMSTIPDCNVHYVHPATTVVPSTCHACVTSQTELGEIKSTSVLLHPPNINQERSKGNIDTMVMDAPAPYSVYSMPMYPHMLSPDMNVPPPPLIPTNVPPLKSLSSTDCIDNNSAVRVMYGTSLDPCYRYGYPTYPYCVIPSGIVYPVQSEQSVQPSADTIRLPYSYSTTQMPNEFSYSVPVPGTSPKTDLAVYPSSAIYPLSTKKRIMMPNNKGECSYTEPVYQPKNTYPKGPTVTNAPSPIPVVPSHVCPMTYPSYAQPYCYHPYDYCASCPDIQRCDGMAPTYQYPHLVPMAYGDEAYQANQSIYYQP